MRLGHPNPPDKSSPPSLTAPSSLAFVRRFIFARVKDTEHAQEVVKEGFTTANADTTRSRSSSLKEVPTVWDAVETYRRMIMLGQPNRVTKFISSRL
jgi:hypothetical protein